MAEVPFLREQRRDLEEKRQAAVEEQMRNFERGMAPGPPLRGLGRGLAAQSTGIHGMLWHFTRYKY
jgi:hypothetical protein